MKKLVVIVLVLSVLVLMTGCSSLMPHPRPWTKQEKALAMIFLAAHTANAYTTETHQDHPGHFYERNPIMGKHPNDTEIVTYFSLTGVGALLVAHFYPELRKPLLAGYAGANIYWTVRDQKMIKDEGF